MALETGTVSRAARLALLPASAVARAGSGWWRRRILNEDPAESRARVRQANADQLRRVLGDMKGGVLKAGQFLSTVDSLFPPDDDATWQQALTSLQESNPGLPYDEVRGQVEDALGRPGHGLLAGIDEIPVAAASLGQVHRGRWADGREVAVKVQYPGIAAAVSADLAMLTAVLRLTSVVARGLVVPPVVGELRTRMAEELDYTIEGRHQEAFADAYAGDPTVAVPAVVHATQRVLVTEWLPGRPLVALADAPPHERAAAGLAYQTFLLDAPARSGYLHADPHPGNYRWLPDGRLGVLDFGAVVPMPEGLPPQFGRLVRAFADESGDALRAALVDAHLVRPGRRIDVDSLREVMAPFSEPARNDEFAFSPEWLRSCFDRNAQARDPDYTVGLGLNLPPEHLMTQRVWLGCVGTLCRLRVTIPVRPVLVDHLPGFAATGPG